MKARLSGKLPVGLGAMGCASPQHFNPVLRVHCKGFWGSLLRLEQMQITLCVKNLFAAMVLAEVPSGLFSEPVSTSAPKNGFAPSLYLPYIFINHMKLPVSIFYRSAGGTWPAPLTLGNWRRLGGGWTTASTLIFLNAFIFFFNFYFVSTLLWLKSFELHIVEQELLPDPLLWSRRETPP